MARGECYVARDYTADVRSHSGSIRRVLGSAAVGVDDVAITRGLRGNGESSGSSAFGKCAVRRADNGLLVTASAQGLCQRPERLLPSAPGAFGIDMRDGQGT